MLVIAGDIIVPAIPVIQIIKNNQFDMTKIKAFKEKFFDEVDGKSTKRFVEYLINHAQ